MPTQAMTTYSAIRDRIAAVPRHEGTFFNEIALAEEMGVSRTPVREALLRLGAEGWLQIVPRKGAFVAPISDDEVQAVLEARMLVEEWSVRELVRASADLGERLTALLSAQRDVLDDPSAFITRDQEFHSAILDAAGNPVLRDFYGSLRDRQLRLGLRAVVGDPDRAEQVLREHQAIVDGLRDLDEDAAVAAVRTHLDTTAATVLPHRREHEGRRRP